MKNLPSFIVFFAILISVGCSQGLQGVLNESKQISLSKENQGTFEILGETRGSATVTKFLFFTFGDTHRYSSLSASIRGLVEREALHNALENFASADGLITPKIITKVNDFIFYAKYSSTVEAKAVKLNTGGGQASSFTNLWSFR